MRKTFILDPKWWRTYFILFLNLYLFLQPDQKLLECLAVCCFREWYQDVTQKKTVCIKLIMTIRRISCLSWYQSIIPYYILHITRRFQYHRLNDSAYTCSPFFLTGARPLEAPIPGRITGSASIDTLVRVGLEKQYGTRTPMVVLHDFFPCVDDELSVKRNQVTKLNDL